MDVEITENYIVIRFYATETTTGQTIEILVSYIDRLYKKKF